MALTSTNTVSSTRITSNGTTAVDVVAAPSGSNLRIVKNISVTNQDTVPHGVTIIYNANGTLYNLTNGAVVKIQPSETLVYEVIQILETTTSKLQVKLTEAHTATACDITSTWAEYV